MNDDVLRRLRIWLVSAGATLRRRQPARSGDMLSLCIAEIERMRAKVERLQGQQREPEPTVTGRPTRVGGGMAR